MTEQMELKLAPKTFEELRKSTGRAGWKSILRILRKTGKKVMVAEGPAFMGRYYAVILNGQGFQLESGKAGMTAAFSKSTAPTFTPIRTINQVLEKAIELSGPLEDDPPSVRTPTETEIIEKLVVEIQKILNQQKT